MKDQEAYRLFLKLFRKVQMHQKEAGKEPLTDGRSGEAGTLGHGGT